jgi:hypothetical protein
MTVPRRSALLTIGFLIATSRVLAAAPAAPPEFFGVCGSQQNEPTVYFSGILHGPASAFPSFQSGFNQFLAQHYAYKGVVACLPAANAAIAQNFINSRTVALRNAKKNVVDTGWTEGSVGTQLGAAALAAAVTPNPSAAGTPTGKAGQGPSGAAGTGSDSASAASELTSILTSIFGGAGCNGSASPRSGKGKPGASTGAPSSAGTGTGCQDALSAALSGALGNSAGGAPSAGSGPSTSGAPSSAAEGGLGSAQAQSTKIVVYGCGRRDVQVACVTELTNQNQKETLVQSANVWTDTFIVDDRGDRHPRSNGFFLNIDGDQRSQIDVSYGKTVRFILMFNDVQPKVQKVALRSASGGLDVEEITLVGMDTGRGQSH